MIKISPSQIKTYRACPVKYSWEYVEKVKSPSSLSQQFGSKVHKELEDWLITGVMPRDTPSGRVALQGISELPTPSPTLLVEQEMNILLSDEVTITGRVDLVDLNGDIPIVVDHKTTTSTRWAMTKEQLAHDEQALLYATWIMLEQKVTQVIVRWIYYVYSKTSKTPVGTEVVECLFDLADSYFLDKITAIENTIAEMIEIRKEETPPCELTPNKHSCSGYGGCYHYSKCKELFRI
jgi:CRISPR/Cas system-associated exonuclease Cas4 (RecB family)